MNVKLFDCSLPQQLPVFDAFVTEGEEYPSLCLGVSETLVHRTKKKINAYVIILSFILSFFHQREWRGKIQHYKSKLECLLV